MLSFRKTAQVHVYCPEEYQKLISKILRHHKINFVLNEFNLQRGLPKVVCHYRSAEMTAEQREFLVTATEMGAWVEPLISFLDRKVKYTETELLNADYFLQQKAFSILSNSGNKLWKRVFDFIASLIGIVCLSPILLLTAIAIKLESRGPALYKQRRVGLYNTEFSVIKFRSMRTDAEKDGAKWAQKNDSRVTRVGKFIRKTRLDELPQLINVLRGDMSIIGPRPEREIFIIKLEKSIPYYRFRHAVRPGITGLAQVKYPYGASTEDAIWKHKYDIYYIKHQSFLMDIKIILLTVKTILFAKGI
ncbi:exopolysaccharide biosynthesis polyprenyl glycosylphosphotransferase [Pseudidiomarina planktonica]|uniref:Exopolysaccharide biosynthesis polyprenyl glycosylphosphotransferase n=1 Tax=Pseudidiomarina planktonica TaxID=1323738 RepID=A0A1Y6EKM6_9GAMM|nr:sugar transferase [Pseudidiomarina planktonica]RUO65926.1 sugar transferase [Pseudidiomarina planktonica]SMQ61761.1 exopolysaccharide biosynthesis polyprenyl glycosylphosphotransferase [Pseudidiomarina planktonica]